MPCDLGRGSARDLPSTLVIHSLTHSQDLAWKHTKAGAGEEACPGFFLCQMATGTVELVHHAVCRDRGKGKPPRAPMKVLKTRL